MLPSKKKHLFILISLALLTAGLTIAGCGPHKVQMQKTQLSLLNNQAAALHNNSTTIFAVEITHFDTTIWVKRFGIKTIDDTQVEIVHGMSYEIEHEEISSPLLWEMEYLLREFGHASVEDFIAVYNAKDPIFPGSEFKAIPSRMGQELYWIASRSDHDFEPSEKENP